MTTSNAAIATREYLAFISYRHADNKQQGRQWATWLHQALETYEVPADLVGKTNSRGEVIPERIYPIFRDEDELPADADLANSITNALKHSKLLVVLCSPNAVASTYVADEIRFFKQLGHSDRIIAAMIDGEPNASWDSAKQAAGVLPEAECFPLPLQFIVDEQGELTQQRAEPIAADFRVNLDGKTEQGWTNVEALRQHLKTTTKLTEPQIKATVSGYQQQQQLMLLKIIAGILGVPLGDLTKRDQAYQLEQQRKKAKILKRWLTALFFLALIAIFSGIYAYVKQQDAVNEKRESKLKTADSYITASFYLTKDMKYGQAKNLIKEANDIFLGEGYSNVASAIQYNLAVRESPDPIIEWKIDKEVRKLLPINDLDFLVVSSDKIYKLSLDPSKELVTLFRSSSEIKDVNLDSLSNKLLVVENESVKLFDIKTLNFLFKEELKSKNYKSAFFSNEHDEIIIVSHVKPNKDTDNKKYTEFSFVDIHTGIKKNIYIEGFSSSLQMSKNNKIILVGMERGALEIDVSGSEKKIIGEYFGGQLHGVLNSYAVTSADYTDDYSHVALGFSDGIVDIWNRSSKKLIYSKFHSESNIISKIIITNTSPIEYLYGGSSGFIRKVKSSSINTVFEYDQPVSDMVFFDGVHSASSVILDPDSMPFLLSSSENGVISLSTPVINNNEIKVYDNFMSPILDYSNDGRLIISSNVFLNTLNVIDSDSGNLLKSFEITDIKGAVFAEYPGKLWVLTAGKLSYFDIISGVTSLEFDVKGKGDSILKISGDRRRLLIISENSDVESEGGNYNVELWSVPSKGINDTNFSVDKLFEISSDDVFFDFSSASDIIASINESNTITIANTKTKEINKVKLGNSTPPSFLSISGDGTLIFVGQQNGYIHVYDRSKRLWLKTMRGHEMFVSGLWVSEDNRWLVSSGREGNVKLWELTNGNEVVSFGSKPIFKLAVHPSGRIARVVSGDSRFYDNDDVILVAEKSKTIQIDYSKENENISSKVPDIIDAYIDNNKVDLVQIISEKLLSNKFDISSNALARISLARNDYFSAFNYYSDAAKKGRNEEVYYQLMINGVSRLDETVKRYQLNANATITDTKTGLTWKRCSEGQNWNGSSCIGKGQLFSWENAKKISEDGWQLPTLEELKSLIYCIDDGKLYIPPFDISKGHSSCEDSHPHYESPAINSLVFPNTGYVWFWSSTSVEQDSSKANAVNFLFGGVKQRGKDELYKVRLVRREKSTAQILLN